MDKERKLRRNIPTDEEWERFRKTEGFPTVDRFAKQMKLKLAAREGEKRGWDDVSPEWLFMYLETEVAELKAALLDRDSGNIQIEAVDVANLAMMIWDVVRRPAPQAEGNGGGE